MNSNVSTSARALKGWIRSLNRRPGVYIIENIATGARYVGQGSSLPDRLKGEIDQLMAGSHHSAPLQADWTRYQPEQFTVSVAYAASPSAARQEEIWLALQARAYEDYGGYTQRVQQNCISASLRDTERKLLRLRSKRYALLPGVDLRARVPTVLMETFCRKNRPLIETWNPLRGYFVKNNRRDFASWYADAIHYRPSCPAPWLCRARSLS